MVDYSYGKKAVAFDCVKSFFLRELDYFSGPLTAPPELSDDLFLMGISLMKIALRYLSEALATSTFWSCEYFEQRVLLQDILSNLGSTDEEFVSTYNVRICGHMGSAYDNIKDLSFDFEGWRVVIFNFLEIFNGVVPSDYALRSTAGVYKGEVDMESAFEDNSVKFIRTGFILGLLQKDLDYQRRVLDYLSSVILNYSGALRDSLVSVVYVLAWLVPLRVYNNYFTITPLNASSAAVTVRYFSEGELPMLLKVAQSLLERVLGERVSSVEITSTGVTGDTGDEVYLTYVEWRVIFSNV